MKSGCRRVGSGARSIVETKWTQACGMQKQQLVRALGLLWKRVEEITPLDTRIENDILALSLRLQVIFTNAKWNKPKVHDTVINNSYIFSSKHFFKPPRKTSRDGGRR